MEYKNAGIIVGCLLLVIGGITGAISSKQERSLIDTQMLLERSLKLSDVSVSQKLAYPLIYALLESKCDAGVITETKKLAETMKFSTTITTQTSPPDLIKRFGSLKKLLLAINTADEATFCKQKYLFYALLEQTQLLYLEAQTTNKLTAQATQVTQALQTTNLHITQIPITKEEPLHDSAPTEVITEQTHLSLINNTDSLSTPTELALATRAETQLQKEIGMLIDFGFLKETDLNILNEKISINYVNGCGTTKGSYHMTQRSDGSNKKFKAINLNINLCSTEKYLNNFEKYVRQILVHELAHYFYYFKDPQSTTFNPICWEGTTTTCTSEDFVSTYAMKNADEDYAESFTYWYLATYLQDKMIVDQAHNSANPSTEKLKEKVTYFEQTYQK
ncbi:MAG: putative zinc-binding metallopeptidase [Candidatus Peribacteria bacterium]|jgi:hypothetical protein|nr:putative zinc-binding metallopeptidase [Candidatus Peribacteria bacterium]